MNLPQEWQQVASSPILIALVALFVISAVTLFLAPVFFKFIKAAKLPGCFSIVKKYPRRFFSLIFVVFILVFVGYVIYYFNQPARIVSASQVKLEKGRAIGKLQAGRLSTWVEARIYLIDVRSREEYAVSHLKNSSSNPATMTIETAPLENTTVVVYSSSSRLDEARKVADKIVKNGTSKRYKAKPGKIYVVRDGFEGLKKAGFATEKGGWD